MSNKLLLQRRRKISQESYHHPRGKKVLSSPMRKKVLSPNLRTWPLTPPTTHLGKRWPSPFSNSSLHPFPEPLPPECHLALRWPFHSRPSAPSKSARGVPGYRRSWLRSGTSTRHREVLALPAIGLTADCCLAEQLIRFLCLCGAKERVFKGLAYSVQDLLSYF